MPARGVNPNNPASYLRRNPQEILRILRFAGRQIGVPYTWGGTTRAGGFDCSGLIYAAYRRAGYQGIGRTTYDQVKQGVGVGRNQLQPGDIVFPEPGHEGLYVGNGMILEAPHTGDHVKLIPLQQFGFWQARRLIRGGGGVTPPPRLGGVSQTGLPVPHPAVLAQQQHLAQLMKAQTRQFSNAILQQQNSFKQQLAANNQSQLASQFAQQAQQRVQGAQQAQQGLNPNGLGAQPVDTQQVLGAQGKSALDLIRQGALQRQGITA
jgi:hypothetical protein